MHDVTIIFFFVKNILIIIIIINIIIIIIIIMIIVIGLIPTLVLIGCFERTVILCGGTKTQKQQHIIQHSNSGCWTGVLVT